MPAPPPTIYPTAPDDITNDYATGTPNDPIILDRCRHCTPDNSFQYTCRKWTTKIIFGMPPSNLQYKALSYVWGPTTPTTLHCTHCHQILTIPMQSAFKLRRLLMLTDFPGQSVWLDALSIDQTSAAHKKAMIARMGDVYAGAKSVAVLLPDEDAFMLLWRLADHAAYINNRRDMFRGGTSEQDGAQLSARCQSFFAAMGQLEQSLASYAYWRRAWTFQEWALARDVDVSWEAKLIQNVVGVKSSIIAAATLMCAYKMHQGQFAMVRIGLDRGEVPRRFEAIKRLFPDEEAFLSIDATNESDMATSLANSSMLFGQALGLRSVPSADFNFLNTNPPVYLTYDLRPGLPASAETRFHERLSMALNALGTSKREAQFEADLIGCWAGMCNIVYDYSEHDGFAEALQKVLAELRGRYGLRVFNFLVSTQGAGAEVDVKFLEYATAHNQSNARNRAYFHGTPVFTGRVDTLTHLLLAISVPPPASRPVLRGRGVQLRRVKHATIADSGSLKSLDSGRCLYCSVAGQADGMAFTDVLSDLFKVLDKPPEGVSLEGKYMVVADVKYQNRRGQEFLYAWAICPDSVAVKDLFIAVEELNHTLVVAAPAGGGNGFVVVAYLMLTDQLSGSHLVQVDAQGMIDLVLKTPMMTHMMNSAILAERRIQGKVDFEGTPIIAF